MSPLPGTGLPGMEPLLRLAREGCEGTQQCFPNERTVMPLHR